MRSGKKIYADALIICAMLSLASFAGVSRGATQAVLGKAAETKMERCTDVGQFGSIAALVRRTSSNYHIYQVQVDPLVQQAQRRYSSAWDVADQTGRYVFDKKGAIDPQTASQQLYNECMHHPERFRVVY